MSEAFHPDRNLPDCMMPDGGECCTGHAAVCEDWHKQRATISSLTAENERLRKLVRSAYNEGFSEGMDEFTRSRGGKPWPDSKSCAALENSNN